MNGDPHAPLRRDVKELGALPGRVLREQGGAQLFKAVEQVRGLAKDARRRDKKNLADLARRLFVLPSGESVQLARAFSHFLTLANIAEQHHRVRRGRQYRLGPLDPQRPARHDQRNRHRDAQHGLKPSVDLGAESRVRGAYGPTPQLQP